jgi:hypothetical protein
LAKKRAEVIAAECKSNYLMSVTVPFS